MPRGPALGGPPAWLWPEARDAWGKLAASLPWLRRSDRGIVEIAARLAGEMRQGRDMSILRLNLLRQCLGWLGATPEDAAKIGTPDDAEEDPTDVFFERRQ